MCKGSLSSTGLVIHDGNLVVYDGLARCPSGRATPGTSPVSTSSPATTRIVPPTLRLCPIETHAPGVFDGVFDAELDAALARGRR
jgi:hypothetical protein